MNTTILLIIFVGIIVALAALLGIVVSMRNFARSNRQTMVDDRLWQAMLEDESLSSELKEALVKKNTPQAEHHEQPLAETDTTETYTDSGGNNIKEKTVQVDSEEGQRADALIIELVENQLADNDPPETKQALERLMQSGESRDNAMQYIASALSIEVLHAMKYREPYKYERYVKNLNALPDSPQESDE